MSQHTPVLVVAVGCVHVTARALSRRRQRSTEERFLVTGGAGATSSLSSSVSSTRTRRQIGVAVVLGGLRATFALGARTARGTNQSTAIQYTQCFTIYRVFDAPPHTPDNNVFQSVLESGFGRVM